MKIADLFSGALGIVAVLGSLALGVFYLVVGWNGIENAFGWWWGWAAFLLALLFRFSLPITVGVFLYARDSWDWPWWAALLLAAPGLLFMVPSLFAAAASVLRRR